MSDTPRSDAALLRFGGFCIRVRALLLRGRRRVLLFAEFCERMRARLESGKRVYGDQSFERPLISVIEEIRQEALDQAGWSFIGLEKLSAEPPIEGDPGLASLATEIQEGFRDQAARAYAAYEALAVLEKKVEILQARKRERELALAAK